MMSSEREIEAEEWGGLWPDLGAREIDAGPDESGGPARAPDAGAWPEEMDDVRFYADSALTIPGKSESPSDCGEWGFREFCDTCGEPRAGPHRCQQRKCPDCSDTWRGNDAASITARLSAARREADGADSRVVHCSVSPPPGETISLVDYWGGFGDAYDLAEAKGIRGGVAFAHGWRVKDRVKRVFRQLSDAEVITEGALWQWVRANDKDWRAQVYWSPHYHIIGLSPDVGADHPDEQDGWVFRRLSSDAWFNFTESDSYESVFRMAMYVLSHVGFEADSQKQVVRWFGSLAYNSFSGIEALEEWEQSVVLRNVEEVTGRDLSDDDGGSESERDCPEDGCEGLLQPIWNAGRYLTDVDWCSQIGRTQERRLVTAFELAIGDLKPPPGMKHPDNEEHLEEVLDMLMRSPNG
jgi:hypothetical protein